MGQSLVLPFTPSVSDRLPSPDLPSEIIFEILKHFQPESDSPADSRGCLEVTKFRLLTCQWNLCVVHWLKTTCGGQMICLRAKKFADEYCPKESRPSSERTAAAFHWHKKRMQSIGWMAFKLEHFESFPAFAILQLEIFDYYWKETLIGPELEEVIRCLNCPAVKTAIVKIEANEIAAPSRLFEQFLSPELAEKLVKLDWMVTGMSHDKIVIFHKFLSQCKNLKEFEVEVKKDSLDHFLKLAATLCITGKVSTQKYMLPGDRFCYFKQHSMDVTENQARLFSELVKHASASKLFYLKHFSQIPKFLMSCESIRVPIGFFVRLLTTTIMSNLTVAFN